MKSTNSFLDLWNLIVLGIIQVDVYKKQLVTLIWGERERDGLKIQTWKIKAVETM